MGPMNDELIKQIELFKKHAIKKEVRYDKIYLAPGWHGVKMRENEKPEKKWLSENIKGDYRIFGNVQAGLTFVFKKQSDATLFALRWV